MGPSQHLAWAAKRVAETVIDLNRFYLRTHHVPPLYGAGVVYQEEPAGQGFEEFATVPQVITRGWGDCDDLVPWRVAELREAGEPAQVRILWQKAHRGRHAGKKMFHLVVRRKRRNALTGRWEDVRDARGKIQFECPSTNLGMK